MSSPKILIVEDETIVARDLSQQLGALGYEPVGVTRWGEEALALSEKLRPDLVLMDIQLAGGMDGISAAQAIRDRHGIPVVFLTAYASEETLARAKLAEPFGYIIKPFDERELRTVIQMALYKHESEAALRASYEAQAAITRTALDGFLVIAMDGRILQVNDAYCRMSGYTEEEVLQMKLLDLVELGPPGEMEERTRRLAEMGSNRFDHRHRRKDGRMIDVEVSVSYIAADGGRMLAFIRDITERKRADREMRASEERFRTLLQNISTVSVQGYTPDGTTQYWNKASEALYGYTAQEAVGKNLLDLIIPPEMRTEVAEAIRTMTESGRPIPACELSLMKKDGSRVSVFSSHAVVHRPGNLPELFCVDIDLTERERTHRALRDSEAKFASLFQNSPAMMALSKLDDGMLLEVNERFLEMSGFSREEVVGRTSVELGWVRPDHRQAMVDRIRAHGSIKEAELTVRRKDGQTLDTLYSAQLIEIAGEKRLLSSWVDLSERKRVESLLRLQSSALEAAANAILITDREGRIHWVNPAFTKLSGYTLEEALGKTPGALLGSGKHDAAYFQSMWTTILAGKVWQGEIINRRKDGRLITEEMTLTPVTDSRGAITHFIAVKQDVSQRKTLEEKLRHAQKMEAIGQLAGGVAHDFNNIMAGVLMYLSLLQEDSALDHSTRSALREMSREVQRGAALTRQLLAFSRQQAMAPVSLDLNEIVNGLLKMLRRLLGENIEIVSSPSTELPRIQADPGMIEQVVMNLCVNARDAMPEGGRLELKTSCVRFSADALPSHPDASAGTFVRLTVTDTGCGMDETTLQRIFEPFFTTKPLGKGTGLGLATVYGIVRQHRGWVEVNSTIGRGTTFLVYLPVAADITAGPSRSPEKSAVIRGNGEQVLVVEDDAGVRSAAVLTLRYTGYNVIEAESGPSAIAAWEKAGGRVDLLLTDMVMPGGVNGRELAERLRRSKPDLGVVICTGYSQAMAARPIEPGDRITLLAKPFDATLLTGAIHRALGQAKAKT